MFDLEKSSQYDWFLLDKRIGLAWTFFLSIIFTQNLDLEVRFCLVAFSLFFVFLIFRLIEKIEWNAKSVQIHIEQIRERLNWTDSNSDIGVLHDKLANLIDDLDANGLNQHLETIQQKLNDLGH